MAPIGTIVGGAVGGVVVMVAMLLFLLLLCRRQKKIDNEYELNQELSSSYDIEPWSFPPALTAPSFGGNYGYVN